MTNNKKIIHRQEEARIVQLANHELNEQAERLTRKRDEDVYILLKEQAERLTKKRDDDVYRVSQAEAQRELDKYHEAQHDDGRLFRNKGTKGKKQKMIRVRVLVLRLRQSQL